MRGKASSIGVVLLLTLAAAAVGQHAVTTVAGGGPNAIPARSASIGHPVGMASDKAGNLYFADSAFDRVYKVTAAGTLTVFAGTGGAGSSGDSGLAINAELNNPQGVAVDSSGNVFIADSGNEEIREVDPKTGVIQTPDETLLTDGAADVVFADSSGNVYMVDTRQCLVVEMYASWETSRLVAGNNTVGCGYYGDGGPANNAQLYFPHGIYVDKSGNVFIADTGNNVVREVIAKTGFIQTVAGNGLPGYTGDGNAATSAELNQPMDVWVDASGNLLIADTGNNVVRMVSAGKISTIAGNGKAGYSGDGGLAVSARLNGPAALFIDVNQNLLIADELNSVIREVAAATKDIQTFVGNGQQSYAGDGGLATSAQLNDPASVFIDPSGNSYIADEYNNVVREVVAATGKIKTVAGNGKEGYSGDGGPAFKAELAAPTSVFVDAAGNLFIADAHNNAVREVQAATGNIYTVAGNGTPGYSGNGAPAASAQLNRPSVVAVDRAGNIYIADTGNNVIREVTASNGQIKTVAGTGTWGYSGNGGAATSAQLKAPAALFVDSACNIYIADTGNNAVRKVIASSGKIEAVAGNGTTGYSGDNGPASSAQLNAPTGVYVDGGGNLFISDSYNHVIREVAEKTQIITTIAGTGSAGYLDSATPTSAQFDVPLGLAGDRSGNLLIADSENQRIRKITGILGIDPIPPAPPPTFSPGAGYYPATQKVTLSDVAKGATIYFTTNSTTPTASSTKYTSPIAVTGAMTINAVAAASGYSLSPVAQANYTI